MNFPIYLDNNATTPCDPRVVEAMLPYFTRHYGNAASRNHAFGWEAEEAVSIAREQLARLIGAEPKEVVFTSGATESLNLAIKGVAEAYGSKGNHIITSTVEHKAVLDTCRHLERKGLEVTYIPVDATGRLDPAAVEAAIRPTTILLCFMYGNNETGVLLPVDAIASLAKKHNLLFCCDATQAVGKVDIHVREMGIHMVAFSAHKLYGPKGVGALYVSRKDPRVKIAGQIDGGGHERGMRSGTLNVPGIVGFGKAAAILQEEGETEATRIRALRDRLERGLLQLDEVMINGDPAARLPQVTNLSFRHVEAEGLMMHVNKVIALSSGSACTSASLEPSYVLKAMGLTDELAYSSLRFAVGRFTTTEEIDFCIERVVNAVNELRAISPLWEMHMDGSGSARQ